MADTAVVWERFDYPHGETVWQRECPDCDKGLLLTPARFCPRCEGDGWLVTHSDPAVVRAGGEKAEEAGEA